MRTKKQPFTPDDKLMPKAPVTNQVSAKDIEDRIAAAARARGVELKDDAAHFDPTKMGDYYGLPAGEIDGTASEVYMMLVHRGVRPNPDFFYTRVMEHGLTGAEPNRAALARKGYQVVVETDGERECIMRVPHRRLEELQMSDKQRAAAQRAQSRLPQGDESGLHVSGISSEESKISPAELVGSV